MRKACFKSEVRMPSRPLSGLLTQTIFFPLIGGPGKMPSLLKNDSKSEPLLPVGQGQRGWA